MALLMAQRTGRALPAIYNQYLNTQSDPLYVAHREAEQAILRPLFANEFSARRFSGG